MKRINLLVFALLLTPLGVSAELTSPNYIVTGQGFAGGGFTTNASSTSFQNDSESGPLFVYDAATSTSTGGGGDSTATNQPASGTTTPSTPTSTSTPSTQVDDNTSPDSNTGTTESGGGTNTPGTTNEPDATSSVELVAVPTPVNPSSTSTTDIATTTVGSAPNQPSTLNIYVQELGDAVKKVATYVVQPISPYIEPLIKIASGDIGVRSSIGSGLFLTAFGFSRVPLSFTNLTRSLYHLWSNFVGLIVFWKRRRSWGTIYDSETKAPLDPAYVELFDEHDKKVAEAITDLDGRYGFVVEPGVYSLRVRKTNYVFPSRKYSLRDPDVLYSHLYFGGLVDINDAVTSDVPMDPVAFDWNQYEKMRTKQTSFIHRFDPLIVRFLNWLFYVGAVVAIWQAVTDPRFFTVALFLLYVVLIALKVGVGGPVLYGRIEEGGSPLPFVVVRAMQNGHVIKSAVADAAGRYCILVNPGIYQVQLEAHQPNDTYVVVYTTVVKAKHGVINQNLSL